MLKLKQEQIIRIVHDMVREEYEANKFFNGNRIRFNKLTVCDFSVDETKSDYTSGDIFAEPFSLDGNITDAIVFRFTPEHQNRILTNKTEDVIHIEILQKSVNRDMVIAKLNEINSPSNIDTNLNLNIKPKKISMHDIPIDEQNKIIKQTISKANYHRDVLRRKNLNRKLSKKDVEIKYRKGRLNAKPR